MIDLFLKFADEAEANSVLYKEVEVPGRKTIEYTEYLIQGTQAEIDGGDEEVEYDDDDVQGFYPIGNYRTTEVPEGAVVLSSYQATSEVDDPDNMVIELQRKYANIDTIGTIYKPTGEMQDIDGIEMPVMAALDGYHINVRVVGDEDASVLEPYSVVPTVPVRVWG